jgi:peroxiredoxin/Tfp pilus assembly protein PilF
MTTEQRQIRGAVKIIILVLMLGINPLVALALTGEPAPDFGLTGVDGKVYTLSSLKDRPMVMLYFFAVDSKPSHSGLKALDQLCGQYRDSDLQVLAITRSSRARVERFLSHTPIEFPVLLDTGRVSKRYGADRIVPTTCIVGPGLKVLDLIQGGGKSSEVMLVRLAQRALQHRKSQFAQAVSEKVVQSNPQNVSARVVKAYAALDQGKLEESKIVFARLAGQPTGRGRLAGKEGLSAVAAQKGRVQEALELARQVERADPSRGLVNVIKADVLYSQNQKQAAEREYEKAVAKDNTAARHRAKALNQLARIRAGQGRLQQSKALYDRAVAIDPYFIEATANKGLVYEKEGRWDLALDSYTKALGVDKHDSVALALSQRALAMMQLEQNKSEKSRIDTLVKDLAARYRSRSPSQQTTDDPWTSRPLVLSFVNMTETGGLAVRDGFSTVLTSRLAETLNGSGRMRVVERVVVEKLLQELHLGSSELADPATALRLGKVLSARLICTGTLYYLNGNYLLTLRLIDTETTRIAKVITADIAGTGSARTAVQGLNRRILAAVMEQYPLQGYVVQARDQTVMVNLGAAQGVVPGTRFEIVEPARDVTYRGRQLRGLPKVIGQVRIDSVEQDFCRGRVIRTQRPVARDDMLREIITDL